MPFSFMVLGIAIIYMLVFKREGNKRKIPQYIILYAICLIFGFLLPQIHVNQHVSFNLVFCLMLPLPIFYFTKQLQWKEGFWVFSTSIISVLAYVFLTKLNSDYLSMLSISPVILVNFVISTTFLTTPKFAISTILTSYILIDFSNLFFAKNMVGNISLFSISIINAIVINLLLYFVIHFVYKHYKQKSIVREGVHEN